MQKRYYLCDLTKAQDLGTIPSKLHSSAQDQVSLNESFVGPNSKDSKILFEPITCLLIVLRPVERMRRFQLKITRNLQHATTT